MSITFIFYGCEPTEPNAGGTSETESVALVRIESFSTPLPKNTQMGDSNLEHLGNLTFKESNTIDNIFLHIIKILIKSVPSSKNNGSFQDEKWLTLMEKDTLINFFKLINGQTAFLGETEIPVGKYNQLRIIIGNGSSVEISGKTYSLKIPSGSQTGIKINLNSSINEDTISLFKDGIIKLFLNFDISKSLKSTGHGYLLKPHFKIFNGNSSGTIQGIIENQNYLITAVAKNYTTSTYPDINGYFKFILPFGKYKISIYDGNTLVNEIKNQKISEQSPDLLLP